MLSKRADWSAETNALTHARERLARDGAELLDLTQSNPTRAGLDYPLEAIADAIGRGARAAYAPEPLGLSSARAAVAQMLSGAHGRVDPADIVITASTSEAYSFLFKLLCDPGEAVLTATPSYPLLEHLASLELISLQSFALEWQQRWELDAFAVRRAITVETRALLLVNPNNPTGSYVTQHEQDSLAAIARECGLAIISDEVFYDFPLDAAARAKPAAFRDDVLAFSMGGLSKSAGLPHLKLGWIHAGGPLAQRRAAVAALELIADNFLSVSTPVQQALPQLLLLGDDIREQIQRRTRANLATLRALLRDVPSAQSLPVEGGWSAVIRVPRIHSDEQLAMLLLERGVIVHPGYFFDFSADGHLVVSLLTEPAIFEEGIRRIAALLAVLS
jgi:aspartate/methionine/tyrosine aminotransferase